MLLVVCDWTAKCYGKIVKIMEGEFIGNDVSECVDEYPRHGLNRHYRTHPEIFVIDCDNGETYDDVDTLKVPNYYHRSSIRSRNAASKRGTVEIIFLFFC